MSRAWFDIIKITEKCRCFTSFEAWCVRQKLVHMHNWKLEAILSDCTSLIVLSDRSSCLQCMHASGPVNKNLTSTDKVLERNS